MASDSNDKRSYPWDAQRTVLRDVDLRKFGARPVNLKLSKLWKTGGQNVIAILRAEMQKARSMDSKTETDPDPEL
ncbi:MAG TPA: hypothetical protein EYN91_27510 [Candidatus Melainabacteria bacterium]|nr:hypothetical protein [Candidatus Melainabacteria bacterium]